MRARSLVARALAVSFILCFFSTASSANGACPSEGDEVYIVKDGDILSDIGIRFYSPSGKAQVLVIWKSLATYNKEAIGPDPDRFRYGTGTTLCLPERLSGAGWTLLRKEASSPAPAPSRTGAVATPAESAPAATAPDKDPVRVDVHIHVDPPAAPAKGGGEHPSENVDAKPASRPNPLRRIVLDGAVGVMLPLTPALHDSLFRELGVAAINLRFAVGPLEIAPRAMFVGRRGGIDYNDGFESPQTALGGGAALQLGAPFDLGSFRLTPGVETSLLFVWLQVEKKDPVRLGEREEQAITLPCAGAFVRAERSFSHGSRWKAALEVEGDVVLVRIPEKDLSHGFTVNVLGGLGYAF